MLASTYPDEGSAAAAAREIVGARLAACVNTVKISSVYRWRGRLEEGDECLAIFKTAAELRDALRERIASTHPYEVPEIAEIAVPSINAPYLDWIAGCISR